MPRRMHKRNEHLLRPLAPAGNIVLHDRDLASKTVLVAEPIEDPLGCMQLLFRPILVAIIDSTTPLNSSSFGRNGGFLRTYPGGTENFSIFETVLALMPNRSAAARSLIPSIKTACRTHA